MAQHVVVQSKGISKTDKELVQAILGGEMRNAWEPTAPGEGRDERGEKPSWQHTTCRERYRANYDQVFRKKDLVA